MQAITTGERVQYCGLLCYWGLDIDMVTERKVRHKEEQLQPGPWGHVSLYKEENVISIGVR